MRSLIGEKIGMTQIFDQKGDCVPVTLIRVDRCVPILEKTPEQYGYQAVLIAYGNRKNKHTNKPLKGFYDKHKIPFAKLLTEFRDEAMDKSEVGKPLKVDIFNEGDMVDVVGKSKGKGFAGVVKRFGFSGAPASRGTHEAFRGGGSIGMHTFPGRVLKGKKMPGRMGGETVHIKNLKIVRVDVKENILLIKGAVPGSNGQLVRVTGSQNEKS